MSGKQSYETVKALKWLGEKDARTVKEAAKKFNLHESTLWRALGKQLKGQK